MAIPKIIHYCWMSGDPYPADIQECIDSWHEVLPDYEIKLWNTNNFDTDICVYTRQAMEKRKYAFVSDYIRLYALYNEGGIYLDSDVKAIKKFDSLLGEKAFIGFESGGRLGPWLIASEAGNPLIKELLDYYVDRCFVDEQGEMDLTPNTVPVTNILVSHGLLPDNCVQKLENITILPEEYFSPKNPWTNRIKITDHTIAMHLFKGAWNDRTQPDLVFISAIKDYLVKFISQLERKTTDIYIYGMGVVGRNVLEQLQEIEIRPSVKAIMVTEKDNPWTKLGDIPIVPISDCDMLRREVPILIATVPRTQDVIAAGLEKHGFSNYYKLGE